MKLTRPSSFRSRAARAARDTRKGSDSIPIDLVNSPAVQAGNPVTAAEVYEEAKPGQIDLSEETVQVCGP